MKSAGYAVYDALANRLEVIRPGESIKRQIPCLNIRPASDTVQGVQIDGDEIWVLVGPKGNTRPDRKVRYQFSPLKEGGSRLL